MINLNYWNEVTKPPPAWLDHSHMHFQYYTIALSNLRPFHCHVKHATLWHTHAGHFKRAEILNNAIMMATRIMTTGDNLHHTTRTLGASVHGVHLLSCSHVEPAASRVLFFKQRHDEICLTTALKNIGELGGRPVLPLPKVLVLLLPLPKVLAETAVAPISSMLGCRDPHSLNRWCRHNCEVIAAARQACVLREADL